MEYGHSIVFHNLKGPKGTAEKLEKQYLLALRDCKSHRKELLSF